MRKWLTISIILVILLSVLSAVIGFFIVSRVPGETKKVTSFEANDQKNHEVEMLVTSPRTNQKITSPFIIRGEARGSWFFEGQLAAELFDENNTSLGKAVLKAEGDWMTNDLVPFTGELSFEKDSHTKATLKIRNDNPSGLAKNQKELIIPLSL